MHNSAEAVRLQEARVQRVPWRKWGPYASERQWGTVREDYSRDGNAWDYFTHPIPACLEIIPTGGDLSGCPSTD